MRNVAALEAHNKRNSFQTPIDAVELIDDGWMVSSNESRLLFWVPPELQEWLWPAQRVKLALDWSRTEFIQLDLSQFVHGSRWSDCYSGSGVHSETP